MRQKKNNLENVWINEPISPAHTISSAVKTDGVMNNLESYPGCTKIRLFMSGKSLSEWSATWIPWNERMYETYSFGSGDKINSNPTLTPAPKETKLSKLLYNWSLINQIILKTWQKISRPIKLPEIKKKWTRKNEWYEKVSESEFRYDWMSS